MARKIFWVVAVLGAFVCLDAALAMMAQPIDSVTPAVKISPVTSVDTVSVDIPVSNDASGAVSGSSGSSAGEAGGGSASVSGQAGMTVVVSSDGEPTVVSTQSGGASEPVANMANPASVYCANLKGTLEIRTDANGGQVGFCSLPGGKVCEEWGLFRGECEGYPAATPSDEQPTTNGSGLLTGGASSDVASAKTVQSQATIVVPSEIQPVATQAVAADANIRALKVEESTVVVKYQQPAKLFGFIPVKYQATITADTESKQVVVKKPWWLFLAKSNFKIFRSMVAEKITAAGDSGQMEGLELQAPMEKISTFMSTLSHILKSYSDTQKGITENLR